MIVLKDDFEKIVSPVVEWLKQVNVGYNPYYRIVVTENGADLVCVHEHVPGGKTENENH